MDGWVIEKSGFDLKDAAADGTRFLCANGYMGLRGVPEEADVSFCPAVTLAGVYDRNGDKWREPVNAPHPLYVKVFWNSDPMALGEREPESHKSALDLRHGVYYRDTDFGPVTVSGSRFVSMADCHLMADRVVIGCREAGRVGIVTGIPEKIWDINGPHFNDLSFEAGETLLIKAHTGEKGIAVVSAQRARFGADVSESFIRDDAGVFRVLEKDVRAGEDLTLDLFAAVCTSLDGPEPAGEAAEACRRAAEKGFDKCLSEHEAAWEAVWDACEIRMDGAGEAETYLRASQYHLNACAPRHARDMSIPARGLSGQTYKGAVFWDSEIFLMPMFLYTQPQIARSLLRYRISTLPGALKKAAEYGYRGAFYAWESQEGGAEGCTDFNVVDVFTHRPVRTYFRDKQIHISADIVHALREYYEVTGDRSLFEEGGDRVALECARFYLSRASCRLDRDEIGFEDVIGPDEYHERVSDNFFTDRMIARCFETALMLEETYADEPDRLRVLIDTLDYARDWERLKDALPRIRSPRTRGGVIEQFDGYFALEDCSLDTVRGRLRDPREYWGGDHGVAGTTQIIKQADVIALEALLPELFTDEQVAADWAYYEPRTEHGSSLSACMYALTALRIGRLDEAWRLFIKTAAIDVQGGGKEWAGEIYIGGTHPASNGGAWMIAALGFAGLRVKNGVPSLDPRLPDQVERLSFPIVCGGRKMRVTVTRDGGSIDPA